MAGLDIPTKSDFLDTHTAQHISVLLPKTKSGSRGPPSELPPAEVGILSFLTQGEPATSTHSLLLLFRETAEANGQVVASKHSLCTARPSPNVEAPQCLRKPILANFVSDLG